MPPPNRPALQPCVQKMEETFDHHHHHDTLAGAAAAAAGEALGELAGEKKYGSLPSWNIVVLGTVGGILFFELICHQVWGGGGGVQAVRTAGLRVDGFFSDDVPHPSCKRCIVIYRMSAWGCCCLFGVLFHFVLVFVRVGQGLLPMPRMSLYGRAR